MSIYKHYKENKECSLPEIWRTHVGDALAFESASLNRPLPGREDKLYVFKILAEPLAEAVYAAAVERVSAYALRTIYLVHITSTKLP